MGPSGRFLVSDVVRGQWNPGEGDRVILNTAMRDGRGVTIREEMEPGSAGKAVCVARAKMIAGCGYKGIPASGDKVTRRRPFVAQAEAGNVDVLRGAFTELALGKHGGGALRPAGWQVAGRDSPRPDHASVADTLTTRPLRAFMSGVGRAELT